MAAQRHRHKAALLACPASRTALRAGCELHTHRRNCSPFPVFGRRRSRSVHLDLMLLLPLLLLLMSLLLLLFVTTLRLLLSLLLRHLLPLLPLLVLAQEQWPHCLQQTS